MQRYVFAERVLAVLDNRSERPLEYARLSLTMGRNRFEGTTLVSRRRDYAERH